jgi:pimeloyl-ACP methyl ester carboxylesterase
MPGGEPPPGGLRPGAPRYLYLHGFASGPTSTKGEFFRERLAAHGIALEQPDLTDGDFEHSTLTRQLAVVERRLAGDPALLVGSSLGGYLAALYAARHPEQIARVLLLAPAFAMARRWSQTLGADTMARWRSEGTRRVYHYGERAERDVAYDLVADGLAYEDFPDVRQPALVVHGRGDAVVAPALSVDFARSRPNVDLVVLDSDHQLLDVLEPIWDRARPFLEINACG